MLNDAEKNAIRDHYRTLSEGLPGFRPRAAQRTMLAEIANAFGRSKEAEPGDTTPPERNGESLVVIEGPTGVGKSLAYLLAGGTMAKFRNKKLVVSSATIALQEQLVNRDLPFIVEKSGLPLTFALAKGRGRYACPYRLYQLTAEHAQADLLGPDPSFAVWDRKPEEGEVEKLKELADAFYYRNWNGDRDAWPTVIEDSLWGRITNDRHGCLKAACPNRPECPFYLARETLEAVDVVVTNHDLLLADVAMGGGVILPVPDNSFYCIDEAHHLAKKAVNQFSAEHSHAQAMFWLDKVSGVAVRVETLTSGKEQIVSELIEAAAAAMESLTEWLWLLDSEPALAATSENLEPTWLIEDGKLPERLTIPAANMALAARQVAKHLESLTEALGEARKDRPQDAALIDRTSSDLGFLLGRAEQLNAVWDLFEQEAAENAPPIAKWITRSTSGKGDYRFSASPVSAAASLASTLWRRAGAALLTSATLRSLGEFELLLSQTGLKWLPETTCVALESPFDFENQGELYLPPLTASPKDPIGHTRDVVEWLPKLVSLEEPVGTLVLFSSRKQMQDVSAALPETFREKLLVQGELPKSVLLEQHYHRLEARQSSIIFGLDSFAEGLDLPGDACVHVIIVKLPFAMPDDPVGRTLSRWVEKRGGNPFVEITVPEASIKLVQAVGRLIRTEQDYGRVTILDNRITRQSYGKKLLASLPPFKRL